MIKCVLRMNSNMSPVIFLNAKWGNGKTGVDVRKHVVVVNKFSVESAMVMTVDRLNGCNLLNAQQKNVLMFGVHGVLGVIVAFLVVAENRKKNGFLLKALARYLSISQLYSKCLLIRTLIFQKRLKGKRESVSKDCNTHTCGWSQWSECERTCDGTVKKEFLKKLFLINDNLSTLLPNEFQF